MKIQRNRSFSIEKVVSLMESDQDLFPWSSESETASFIQQLIQLLSVRLILEIGTFKGYTTLHMLQVLSSEGQLFTIDIEDYAQKYFRLLKPKVGGKLHFFQSDIVQFKKNTVPSCFDLIFIDADHSFFHSFTDFKETICFHKQETIIVFHDSLNPLFPGVKKVVRWIRNVNLCLLGKYCDVLDFKTPLKTGRAMSGITLVKVKSGNKILKRIFSFLISMNPDYYLFPKIVKKK
jgi:predicted O-methyltransferase YrrM